MALRSNHGQPGRVLPAEGYQGPIPKWPLGDDPEDPLLLSRWEHLWRTPQAVAWIEMNSAPTVARYVLAEAAALAAFGQGRSNGALLAEVRQIEDRLGLSPAGLASLRWQIGNPPKLPSEEVPGQTNVRRRVRAVDPQ